jgi:hypothetical protein
LINDKNYLLILLVPVVVIVVFGSILLVFGRYMGQRAREARAVTHLVGPGIPSTAEVLEVQDTGLRNHRIYILVRLRLAVRGAAEFGAFQAETLAAISPVQIPEFSRGKEIRVKVDATQHSRVVIDQPIR